MDGMFKLLTPSETLSPERVNRFGIVALRRGRMRGYRRVGLNCPRTSANCTPLLVARFLNWRDAGRRAIDMADGHRNATTPVQKVVVVNGNTEVLGMLETVLDAGRYDMVFVESSDRAYSHIKKILPNLVILCARIEDLGGFQLLTMLKLDRETQNIPVLTYTTEYEGQDFDAAISQIAEEEEELLPSRPALRMN
jgi:PleD family two-component response regulator